MEYLCKTKKLRLIADFSLDNTCGWCGGGIKHIDSSWKFQSYKGTNLGSYMICESVNSYQEENE